MKKLRNKSICMCALTQYINTAPDKIALMYAPSCSVCAPAAILTMLQDFSPQMH